MYHSVIVEYNYRYSGLSRQVREINVYCPIFFNATHSIARYGRDSCLRQYFGAFFMLVAFLEDSQDTSSAEV